MTAEEYLSQGLFLELEIEEMKERLSMLADRQTWMGNILTGMPKNPNKGTSTVESSTVDYWDLYERLEAKLKEYKKLLASIINTIEMVPDPRYRLILSYKYLHHMTWNEIAEEMHYTREYIFILKKKALDSVSVP